jgi:cation:H+ antiporter
MIQNIITLSISLLILIWSCDYAIKNAIVVSKIFNVREIFIGIFIIAIGTSLPEFASTIQAIYLNSPYILAGNLVGSNIANILLVGGIMLFPLSKLIIHKSDYSSLVFFLVLSILFFLFIIWDYKLGLLHAVFFIFLSIVFFYFELKKPLDDDEFEPNKFSNKKIPLLIFKILIAFIALFFSSKFFISSAKNLTEIFGIAETTVGITIVAFGTSLPEIVATIISIIQKQNKLAIGNIIGSNIANIIGITLIAIFIQGEINYYDLLTTIDKFVFLSSAIIFSIIIYFRITGKFISLVLIISYLAYFMYLYV